MGIDPVTHKPKSDSLNPGQVKVAATLSHIAQWESVRLEAEARESTLLRSFSSSSAQLILNKANALPPLPSPPLPLQPLCLDVLTACKGAWLTTLLKENGSTITGTLEAPTSTLNFSDKKLLIPNLGKSNNNIGEVKESMDNTVLVPNFMEGLTDLFIENSHDHLDHDLNDFEENNNYWNNILNLVNSTSPSIDSPVF
ncbi:hypothetical protein HYC85_023372 [Camellia sinensis]|uniref:Uncharacterized protein n=1 Tax=Camellia sinensis TaxID=4442 RepID=A0A7J7GED4_CAMSI|nr:hypothetical protein HYC85_023372 [Camellia sinensis]